MKIDRIRGTINLPLDKEGIADAKKVATILAGKVDIIFSSYLIRAKQTAQFIKGTNPNAEGPFDIDDFGPWPLGEYEGQPTSEVMPKILALSKTPNTKAPGRSPSSTRPGESFNSWSDGVLGIVDIFLDWIEQHPEETIIAVTHLRDVKLTEAYAKAGMPKSHKFSIDSMSEMKKEDPGSMFKVERGDIEPVKKWIGPGLYLVRHGSTELNGDASS